MKFTLIEKATGRRIRAYGVDVREMLATGAYQLEASGAKAIEAVQSAASAHELVGLRLAPALLTALVAAGFNSLSSIAEATVEQLVEVKGVGEKMAPRLIADAKAAITLDPDPDGGTAQ